MARLTKKIEPAYRGGSRGSWVGVGLTQINEAGALIGTDAHHVDAIDCMREHIEPLAVARREGYQRQVCGGVRSKVHITASIW
jgi:hypothetical protein